MDRLTSLLDRFRLNVAPVSLDAANMAVLTSMDSARQRLIFQPRTSGIQAYQDRVLIAHRVDFGSETNPLRTALPDRVEEPIQPNSDLANLVNLLVSEQEALRCGAPAVLCRLGEVLVVRILRMQLERGATEPGLFSGLAHPRISHAILAIHQDPERLWRNSDLAELAGLSHSRFKELFAATVGETPMGYLRRWRMALARMDLERGERVARVAYRYGYRAPDAFSRAYLKEFGLRPRESMQEG